MKTRIPLGVALLFFGVGATPAAKEAISARPKVAELRARLDGQSVLASFYLEGVPTPEAVERVRSGVPVTYRHRIELVHRRALPIWPAKALARVRIDATAVYDSLTHQYELTRAIEIRSPQSGRSTRVDRQRVDSLEDVRAWMCRFDDLPPLGIPEGVSRTRLRVRVESTLDRRYLLYLVPSKLTVSAEAEISP